MYFFLLNCIYIAYTTYKKGDFLRFHNEIVRHNIIVHYFHNCISSVSRMHTWIAFWNAIHTLFNKPLFGILTPSDGNPRLNNIIQLNPHFQKVLESFKSLGFTSSTERQSYTGKALTVFQTKESRLDSWRGNYVAPCVKLNIRFPFSLNDFKQCYKLIRLTTYFISTSFIYEWSWR